MKSESFFVLRSFASADDNSATKNYAVYLACNIVDCIKALPHGAMEFMKRLKVAAAKHIVTIIAIIFQWFQHSIYTMTSKERKRARASKQQKERLTMRDFVLLDVNNTPCHINIQQQQKRHRS